MPPAVDCPLEEVLDLRQSKSRSQTSAFLPWVVTLLTHQEDEGHLSLCLNVNQIPYPQCGPGQMGSLPQPCIMLLPYQ